MTGSPGGNEPTTPPTPYAIGDAIGPYKLLRILGEGGMGTVYEAEQTRPVVRRVALKVIKPGMDTKQVIARFEAERQALAVMDHPGIAKVLDAGSTASGHPFFVMELVVGVPMIEYCDIHRLRTHERLALFARLCRAVQHAHQKGVVHRDLKPSNVLVNERDGTPMPTIIDFGVAKAIGLQLTDQTLVTVFGQALGTPAYMSPEQAGASGLDVDTRTDIYSLGVILYELLVDRLPFDDKELHGPAFVLRLASRQTNPPTPSTRFQGLGEYQRPIASFRRTDPTTLHRELRGDIDWIVMKAMHTERNRRYETANDLALDIDRHLAHETVSARPPSARYRLAKFIERNRVAATMAAALATVVLLGLVGTSVGLVRARRAEMAAAQEAATAQGALGFMIGLFQAADPNQTGGDTISARELLTRGVARVDSLEGAPLVQGRLLQAMGAVYTSLGLYDQADTLLRRALDIRRAAFGEGDAELERSLRQLAWLYNAEGRYPEALPLARQSLTIAEHVYEADSPLYADALQAIGMIERNLLMYDEARAHLEQSLDIREKVYGPDHAITGWSIFHLAWLDQLTGNYDAATTAYEQLLPIHAEVFGTNHPIYAQTLNDYAVLLEEGFGAYDSARALYGRVLAIRERALGPDHLDVARVLNNIGTTFFDQDRPAEARPYLERAVRIAETTLGPDHVGVRLYVHSLGQMHLRLSEYGRAGPMFERALALGERAFGPSHPDLHNNHLSLAILHYQSGDLEGAAAALERAASLHGQEGLDVTVVGLVIQHQGRVALAEGQTDAAKAYASQMIALASTDRRARTILPSALWTMGEALLLEGRLDSADIVIREAVRLERAREMPSHGVLADLLWVNGRVSLTRGDREAADSLFSQALVHERANHGEASLHFVLDRAARSVLLGDEREGLALLREAVDAGYHEPILEFDTRLYRLRSHPEFRRLLDIVHQQVHSSD